LTTNVSLLGARLFHHLLALPMAYFQARRVGDSVARVRELESIRNFLTSSALTLIIDPAPPRPSPAPRHCRAQNIAPPS
jgi:ABC-type bacteriocin/lantibiotic exporter with double-glycine peptidase domain